MNNIIKLPPPQTDLPFPLMKALKIRRTKRKWKDEKLSLQHISNLLWAANGITMEATEKAKSRHTHPSSRNSQMIDVYVLLKEGVYKYDDEQHALILTLDKDVRKHIGTQKMMQDAPLGLVYVSDYTKLTMYLSNNEDRRWFVSGAEVGFMSQNVYLYCAAANLNTAVLGLVDREQLHKVMQLGDQQKVVYTQVVGIAN